MALATAIPGRRNLFARAAARLDPMSPAAAQAREREAAFADVGAFARHCRIQDADGAEVAFGAAGWGWQFQLLALWVVTRLCVVLKARQLGVSWLAAMYALWVAIRRPGQSVLLISRSQPDADKLLAKVAYIYDRLPAWKPVAVVNVTTIKFPGLGSEIEALPATANVGRSRTAQLVILDEHAHQPFARKIFLAIKAVAEKGQILSISSANGQGALHSQIYLAAKAGTNGWKAVFIPARAHPGRQAAGWRELQRSEAEQLSDAEFAQEYPDNDVEAITTTGRPVFRHEDLSRQPLERGSAGAPGLTIYRLPQAGKVYVVGADVGEGLATSDWSSAQVLERDTGEQVASLRGRWAPDVFASKIDALARQYARHATATARQPVLVGVERNNHGHAVLLALAKLHAGTAPYQLYRAKDKRLGWLTTSASRPILVDQLEAALRIGAEARERGDELASGILLHDASSVDQMATFAYSDDGKPEAQEGYHDDDVMALGIAIQLRRRAFGRVLDTRKPEGKAA
jgi:hypothetical protein